MATNHHFKRPHQPLSSSSTSYFYIFVSIIGLTALFLLFSHYITSYSPPPMRIESIKPIKQYVPVNNDDNGAESASCDYSEGKWFYDPTARPPRYDETCKEIYKGWNCVAGNRSGAAEIVKWRWQPNHCALPPFDPLRFLESHRDISIGFVGDSLNRNMFVSLFCSLRRVAGEIKKWRPAGADRGFTFLKYNFTIAYHRTNLLARYGRWSANAKGGVLESLGYKEGYRVDVDVPEGTWAEAPSFHNILIYNTGHWWWAPSKFDPVKSPMLFHEKGQPLVPPLSPETGLDVVLRRMISYVEEKARPGTVLFFRTQSPRHFEGGDWDQGGSCPHLQPLSTEEVEQFFSVENNGTNVEVRLVNEHLYEAIKGSAFRLLDVTRMSEFRADAHPSTAGGKKHVDCMHWCLPGITDTWNDLFIAHLSSIKVLQYLDNHCKVHKDAIEFCQDVLRRNSVEWDAVFRSHLSQPIQNVDLVVTIGGDGTLLRASHFLNDSIPLLGVNSDPTQPQEVQEFGDEFDATRSSGYLCAATVKNFEQILNNILEDRTSPSEVSRMSIRVNSIPLSTYALNDVLIVDPCPASVSRFSFMYQRFLV